MFVTMSMIVVVCSVAANPHSTTPSIAHGNMTAGMTTPSIPHRQPTKRPTMAALISEFIRKSEYHFNVIQNDQQGFFKVLKWNMDNAFTALEYQFGKLITQVQQDMKKQNTALKSQNTALDSKMQQSMTAIKARLSEVQQNMTAINDKLTNVQSQNSALKALNKALEMKMEQRMTELETLVNVTKHVSSHGKQLNSVWYIIMKCNPACTIATGKEMCNKIGATLAPLRTVQIYNLIHAYQKELGLAWLHVDGSDEVTEGIWVYHDGSGMSYSNWGSGYPSGGTGRNHIELYKDGYMGYMSPNSGANGVACAWE